MTREELADFCIRVDGMSELDQRKIVKLVDIWDDIKDNMHDELHEMNIESSSHDWVTDLSVHWKIGGKYGLDMDFLRVPDIIESLILIKHDLDRDYEIPCRSHVGRMLTHQPEFMKIKCQILGGQVYILYTPQNVYDHKRFSWMKKSDLYRSYCRQKELRGIIKGS